MHFAALFTAFLSVTTVRAALSQKNPGDQNANLQLEELAEGGIKNPTKPPDDFFPAFNPWSGGVLPRPPPSSVYNVPAAFYNYVSAKLTVPNAVIPKGETPKPGTTIGLSAWVGINGYSTNTILQCGVLMEIDAQGKLLIQAFYEDPTAMVLFSGFPVRIGDVLSFRIETSAGGTVGVVTIENETTKKTFARTLKAVDQASVLSGKNAEWIVERYIDTRTNKYTVPLDASFTLTDAVAKSSDGQTFGPQDGIVVNHAPKLLPRVDPGKVTVSYFGG